jgi:outer membrane cobalamin receptor
VFFSAFSLVAQRTPSLELDPAVVTAAAFPAYEGRSAISKNSDQPPRNRPRFSDGTVLENKLFERLFVRMNLSAVGKKFDLQIPTARRSTEAYVKADLALTFSPNRSWSIFGVPANLTNAKYEDYVGFRAPGTNVRFGMSYRH